MASALLAGMCIGFLPHNFYPARIFMGDIGAMLLGLLLAYGPISSTDSLDPALLTNYAQNHTLDRFPTFLPLLVPAAIFIIPYADLMFAIIRRTRAGKPIMAADRQHLHHRLLNIGHSYRQSVLIMYLWAALFSVAVVSLSIVRSPSVVFFAATLVAVLALLPATMPRLRPWRSGQEQGRARGRAARAPGSAAARVRAAEPVRRGPRRCPAPPSTARRRPATAPAARLCPRRGPFRDPSPFPGDSRPANASAVPADSLPRAGRLPGADPFPGQPVPTATARSPRPRTRSPARRRPSRARTRSRARTAFPGQDAFPAPPFPGQAPFPGSAPFPAAAGARGGPGRRPRPVPAGSAPRRAAQVVPREGRPIPVLYLLLTLPGLGPCRPACRHPGARGLGRNVRLCRRFREPVRRAAGCAGGGSGAAKAGFAGSAAQVGHKLCAIR